MERARADVHRDSWPFEFVVSAMCLAMFVEVTGEMLRLGTTMGCWPWVCAFLALYAERPRLQHILGIPSGTKGSGKLTSARKENAMCRKEPVADNTTKSTRRRSLSTTPWWQSCFMCIGCFPKVHSEGSTAKLAHDAEEGDDSSDCGLDADEHPELAALRERLCDLLGSSGSTARSSQVGQAKRRPRASAADRESAMATVEMYGGRRTCLSRFLRARQTNVDAAEAMLRNTIDFRRRLNVNSILYDPAAVTIWKPLRCLWPMAPVMYTAEGNLVAYTRMAHFFAFTQRGIPEEDIRTLYLAFMEQGLKLQRDGPWRQHGRRDAEMPGMYEVYDFQGVSLSHLRAVFGIRLMARVLRLGQDHYPENLRKAFFLNLPGFAVTSFNTFVRNVFDEKTQAKFTVSSDEGRDMLCTALGATAEDVDKLFRSVLPYDATTSKGDCPSIIGETAMACCRC